jgi:carbon-monoxide dehydrogenase small subunit
MTTTTINGVVITLSEDQLESSVLDFLREELDLTGTKNSCGIGVCGSCTVLVNERAVQACRWKVRDIAGKTVLTIEGLTPQDGTLHPLQQAFVDHGAIQCGFCTPGMVLTAHAFLLRKPHPTRDEIRRAISPNLCRCTGYQQIIDAIEDAAKYYPVSETAIS